jgi:S-adenosylmethionine synthetase
MQNIGKAEHEIDASEILECRQIVKNLNSFGINERQRVQLIYLLSLELESKNAMDIFVEAVKKVKNLDQSVKYSLTQSENDYNSNKPKKLLDV